MRAGACVASEFVSYFWCSERRTHDYVRHGTTTLFAALEVATGNGTAITQPSHRRQEFLRFLRVVAKAYFDQELHLVMDNYSTHKNQRMERPLSTLRLDQDRQTDPRQSQPSRELNHRALANPATSLYLNAAASRSTRSVGCIVSSLLERLPHRVTGDSGRR